MAVCVGGVVHFDVSFGVRVCFRGCGGSVGGRWVEPLGLFGVACDDCDLVRIVASQVSIYEDEEVRDRSR